MELLSTYPFPKAPNPPGDTTPNRGEDDLNAVAEDIIEEYYGAADAAVFAGEQVNACYDLGLPANAAGKSGVSAYSGRHVLMVNANYYGNMPMTVAILVHEWKHVRNTIIEQHPPHASKEEKDRDELATRCSTLETLLIHRQAHIEICENPFMPDGAKPLTCDCELIKFVLDSLNSFGSEVAAEYGDPEWCPENCSWVPAGTSLSDFTNCF